MSGQYKFVYRRRLFKKSFTVVGHAYSQPQDKMLLYFPDGTIREIKKWSGCEVFLGVDWVATTKESFNKDAQRGF